ncbi:MAG: hypothetical protein Q8880_10865 [Bacteroidota bacterium]|nr:hypothetical protein [Bacteroidota bacterium]
MIKKILGLGLISAVLFMFSCKKEEGSLPGGASVDSTSIKSISNVGNEVSQDVKDLTTSEGVQSMVAIMGLMSGNDAFGNLPTGFKSNNTNQSLLLMKKVGLVFSPSILLNKNIPVSKEFKPLIRNLNKTLDGDEASKSYFDFNKYKGIYRWNPGTKDWDKIGSSNEIVMQFPVALKDPNDTSKVTKKNAVLTFHEYSESNILMGGKYLPTKIRLDLFIGGVKEAELAYRGEFGSNGMPKNLNLMVFVKPFTLTANYIDKGLSISFNLTFKNASKQIFSCGTTITFNNSNKIDTSITKMLANVQKIDAYVQIHSLKVAGSADVAALYKIKDNATADDLNRDVKISIYNFDNGSKTGDVVFEKSSTQGSSNMEVYIKFTNGNKMKADEYLNSIKGLLNFGS